MTNVIRYFPTQALNFAFKETFKDMFKIGPHSSHVEKLTKYVLSGGLAGSMSSVFVYSLDYARTRLANNIMGKKE